MQRTSLSEQLLQPTLLQRLVGANRDAIAPTPNLLKGEPMTGDWLAHLNLKLGSWRDRVGPTIVFQRRDAESCSLVDGFGGHLHRMPNTGRTAKADRARPKGHGGPGYHIRFIFAYCRQRSIAAVLGWLRGRVTAAGKSETELAIDVQLASRAASR